MRDNRLYPSLSRERCTRWEIMTRQASNSYGYSSLSFALMMPNTKIISMEKYRVNGIKFTNREIIIEWYAHMFCNRVDPRTIAFINEVQDRDLSMATSMRLEHFHDVCTALLPTSVKRQETTMYFRAMAYESIVKTFGAVGDGSKGDGAFAKLMARPVTFSRLAESMTLLKLKTMDFTKDLRSEKEKHENEMEDNETMLEQDSLFDELNDDKRRESVFMHMAMADLPEDVDNGEWNC